MTANLLRPLLLLLAKHPLAVLRFEEGFGVAVLHSRHGTNRFTIVRPVDDIDQIVKTVRFDGWKATTQGERTVQRELRKTLLKYKLHTDQDLFDKAYGYIRQYY